MNPYDWTLTLPTNGNPDSLKAFHESLNVLQRTILSVLAAEVWGSSAHDVISTTFVHPGTPTTERLRVVISRPSDGVEIAVYRFTDDEGTRQTFNGTIPGPVISMDWEQLAECILDDIGDALNNPLRALADFARLGGHIHELLHRLEEARLPEHEDTPPPNYVFISPARRGRKPDRARRVMTL